MIHRNILIYKILWISYICGQINKFLLYLNIKKCKVLQIGSNKYQNNKTSNYLNGSRIQSSEGEKDLGILFNYNL